MTKAIDRNELLVVEEVRAQLESATLLRLSAERIDVLGSNYESFRLAELPRGIQMFNIAVTANPTGVEAYFIADRFAGPILRKIGERIVSEPSAWTELIAEFSGEGIAIGIRVDDFPYEFGGVETGPWRSLEIEARRRTSRRASRDELVNAWTSVAGALFCLMLRALSLEIIEDFPIGSEEGARHESLSGRVERSPVNRYLSIQHYGRKCWVCDFDFSSEFGPLGGDFIEVHHIRPLALLSESRTIDPIREMVPLCSNCHSMAHRESPPVHPTQLRNLRGLEPKQSIFVSV